MSIKIRTNNTQILKCAYRANSFILLKIEIPLQTGRKLDRIVPIKPSQKGKPKNLHESKHCEKKNLGINWNGGFQV